MSVYRSILRLPMSAANLVPWALMIALCTSAAFAPPLFAAGDGGLLLHSDGFGPGGSLPARFTCDGAGESPPLAWENVPPDTKSLALIVADPDAPDPRAPRMTWIHWVLYDIPARARDVAAGAGAAPDAGIGARSGLNSWGRPGYGGPCPPSGEHRYFFRLYALDTRLRNLDKPTAQQLDAAMEGHVIDKAVLMGKFAHAR